MVKPSFGRSDAMPGRRSLLRSGAAAWLFGQLPAARAAEPLRFGVVPYLPARRLVSYYSPLLPVLADSLGRPAEITCAHDYREHLDRLRSGHFDVVADSLFIARIAQRELGHVPVARTLARLEPLLVVPTTSSLSRLAELKGLSVCLTDRIAALSLVGMRYLRDQGLAPDQQVRILVSGSHANSIHRLLAGDAAAAIVSRTTLKQVDADLARQVRVLAVLPPALAAVVYHVAPHLAPQAAALSRALLNFANQTEPGHQFIAALGHQGLAVMTPAELHSLDPMVVEFYRQLAVSD
jgi:ABC-type phosphate/phosphonate transport system substrate-binding protein